MTDGNSRMPGQPDPWRLVMDQLNRIEANMLTRAEFSAHQQRFDGALIEKDRRIDEVQTRALTAITDWRTESIGEHKELEAKIETVEKDVREVRKEREADDKERRKDRSTRWFAVALAGVSVLFGLFRDVLLGGVG